MKYGFSDGAIAVNGRLYEDVIYDVSNNVCSATFNGRGCFTAYSLPNEQGDDYDKRNFLVISYNGVMQDVLLDKTVIMKGRRQTIRIALDPAVLEISLFLSPDTNGIYTSYKLITPRADDIVELRLTGYMFGDEDADGITVIEDDDKAFASDKPFCYIASNHTIGFALCAAASELHSVFAVGKNRDVCRAVSGFADAENKLCDEMNNIRLPKNLTECEKALFYSSYYCALENFKDFGEYKGFMAGSRYIFPPRTYYRDSFFTVLPMYNGNAGLVRSQILTLAKGIGDDGNCPSAVVYDWSSFWGNHFDSPSFLAIMLYDYINHTGEVSFANESAGDMTVFDKTLRAFDALSRFADESGLLNKDGRFNKRDWADEVNRYGYVTYDEILYARAAFSIAKIYGLLGQNDKMREYEKRYEIIKNAINEMLWDDEAGYYINFKNEDYTENNLSLDTVFAAIFGIADEEKSIRMLNNMEQMIECKNNGCDEDFGCMCVYPFYCGIDSAYKKSSQSYNYHNGANWPYLTAMYALARRKFGMEYKHLLVADFKYNLKKGNFTPIEYFSPYCADGSLLQAWSGNAAFVLDESLSRDFWE